MRRAACVLLALGLSGPSTGQTCAPGTISASGVAPCSVCPEGTFSPTPGGTFCIPCPRTTFAAPGSSFCRACVPEGLPMVKQQPADVAARSREQIVLTAVAVSPAGVGAPTYYWRRNGVTVMDGGPWLGAQTGTLFIDPASMGAAGEYDAVCMNPCGFVGSSAAKVTITCPADFDGNGALEPADIFGFVDAWFAGDLSADANGDGVEAVGDVLTYLDHWAAGC